ncbi:MAG: exodeoxyribonuclease VII small subunit [Candidatus Margulisiibacteriota bacterium]
MAKSVQNYKKAYEGLEQIFEELQSGNIGVDELDTNLKKALEYIKTCKDVLKKQEVKVNEILKEIEKEE